MQSLIHQQKFIFILYNKPKVKFTNHSVRFDFYVIIIVHHVITNIVFKCICICRSQSLHNFKQIKGNLFTLWKICFRSCRNNNIFRYICSNNKLNCIFVSYVGFKFCKKWNCGYYMFLKLKLALGSYGFEIIQVNHQILPTPATKCQQISTPT